MIKLLAGRLQEHLMVQTKARAEGKRKPGKTPYVHAQLFLCEEISHANNGCRSHADV